MSNSEVIVIGLADLIPEESVNKANIKESIQRARGFGLTNIQDSEIDSDIVSLSMTDFEAKYLPILDVDYEI